MTQKQLMDEVRKEFPKAKYAYGVLELGDGCQCGTPWACSKRKHETRFFIDEVDSEEFPFCCAGSVLGDISLSRFDNIPAKTTRFVLHFLLLEEEIRAAGFLMYTTVATKEYKILEKVLGERGWKMIQECRNLNTGNIVRVWIWGRPKRKQAAAKIPGGEKMCKYCGDGVGENCSCRER